MNSPDQLQQATSFLEESIERGAGGEAAAVGSMALRQEMQAVPATNPETPARVNMLDHYVVVTYGGYGGVPVEPEPYRPL